MPVADCSDKYYNSQKKEEQVLKTFLEYWKSYVCNNYSPELPCYYLKVRLQLFIFADVFIRVVAC